MKWGGGSLLVVMFVAIIVPNLVRARTSNGEACLPNLQHIDGAVQQWALENGKTDEDVPDLAGVLKYLPKGVMPKCYKGGIYHLGKTVGDRPTCSKAVEFGHSLAPRDNPRK